jgi:hypothetical protein
MINPKTIGCARLEWTPVATQPTLQRELVCVKLSFPRGIPGTVIRKPIGHLILSCPDS